MNVLVIGSGGMLGHTITLYLRHYGFTVTDISRHNKVDSNTILLDVLECNTLSFEYLSSFDVVVNCAALLVSQSESDKPSAIMLNSWFPHMLESMLCDTETKIIQVSTDGVFSGSDAPYFENSTPDTKTFYGRTKNLGELDNKKDLTVRANLVGPCIRKDATGLFHWFVQQSGCVPGYSTVMFNAITSLEFAKFVVFAIQKNINGIYHLGASETISKASFLHKVKNQFNLINININDVQNNITDNTVISIRNDIHYIRKSYEEMLKELKLWMCDNKEIYSHYSFI